MIEERRKNKEGLIAKLANITLLIYNYEQISEIFKI